jgi:hypothetical protein
MNRLKAFLLLACLLLPACSSATPSATPVPITVQYTAASIPWLANVYTCAGANGITAEQRAADFLDPQTVDMAIRVGQPENLVTPAYQIGNEDILVAVNKLNPISTLTADQLRGLFSGQIQNWQALNGSEATVQVWVFAAGEDVQQIFEQTILGGSPVTSLARLATSPDEMSKGIANDINAIGILTRHWKAGNVTEVFTVATVPVLAITAGQPSGALPGIIACLQK